MTTDPHVFQEDDDEGKDPLKCAVCSTPRGGAYHIVPISELSDDALAYQARAAEIHDDTEYLRALFDEIDLRNWREEIGEIVEAWEEDRLTGTVALEQLAALRRHIAPADATATRYPDGSRGEVLVDIDEVDKRIHQWEDR